MNKRYYYNKLILNTLSYLVEIYPDLRFGQLLWDTKILVNEKDSQEIKDPYYEEPDVTWGRLEVP